MCFVSPAAKQMTSNMVVPMRKVMQMFCWHLNSNLRSLAAVAGSAALFTHCQGSGFSDDKFCHPKSKNASKNKELSFLVQTRQTNFFVLQLTCMYARVPKSGIDNVACSSSVFEAMLLSVRGCS